jgi:sulfonate transport system substrate-binding protein
MRINLRDGIGQSRRRFLFAGGALGAAVWMSNQSLAGSGEPLRVAIYKGIGDYKLMFHAAGLPAPSFPVSYEEFGSGKVILEAMNAGSLDLGSMSEIPPVFSIPSRPRLKLIGVIKGDVNNQAVLIQRDSKITSIADLKGKRVGYVRATTSHYFLLKMLAEAGLTFDDIVPVNLTPPDGQAAFAKGALDAWAIYGYSIPLAIHLNGARVLKTALGYLSGNYLLAAHPETIADPKRHAEIEELLRQLRAALAWGNANPEAWAELEAKSLGLPKEIVLEETLKQSSPWLSAPVDDAVIASQQEVADVFARAGLIQEPVDVSKLWDRSFNFVLAGN